MAREWMYNKDQATIYPLDDLSAGFVPGQPQPPTPFTKVWWVGASSASQGSSESTAQHRTDLLALCDNIAAAIGKSSSFVRSNMMYHAYNGGMNWDASTDGNCQWVKANGFKGIFLNNHPGDYPGWAAGNWDNQFKNYLQSIVSFMAGYKFLVNIEHEPENNLPTGQMNQTYGNQWAQGTARFMKLTYELGNPDIIFCTATIPSGGNGQRSWFNPRPYLDQLCGGDLNHSQAIMDASIQGMDVYPEVNADGTLETIQSRCGAALADYKSWGFSRFYHPEIAFYNWIEKTNSSAGLTAVQKAQRLKDQLWTFGKANGYEGYCYYDIGDGTGGRTDHRRMDSPEEWAVYGKIIQNIAP